MQRRSGWPAVALLVALESCTADSARRVAAPPAPPTTCADSKASADAARLLGEGRIARAVGVFATVSTECKQARADVWGEIIVALAELGRGQAARSEAADADATRDASPALREATRRALDHLTRFEKAGGDQNPMLAVYDRALEEERAGHGVRALASYLEAWERFRPNPQALVRAARLARNSGDAPRARRLSDRALVELAPTQSTPVRAQTWSRGQLESVWLDWLPGSRAFAVNTPTGPELECSEGVTLPRDQILSWTPSGGRRERLMLSASSLMLALGRRVFASKTEDPVTRVWRPGSREALPNAPRDDSPRTAAMVDDLFGPVFQEDPSGVVAFLSDAGTLVVRSPDGREKRAVRPPPAELSGAAIVPNGAALLVGDDRGIRRLSLRSAALGWLGARGLPSSNLGYSRDGRWLLATGSRIVLLDAATGTIRHETAHASMLDARLSADGQQVVAVGSDGALVWDLPSGKTLTHAREAEDPLGVALRATATCCAGSYTLGPDTSAYTKTRAEYFTGAIGLSGDGKRLAIGHIGVQSPRSDNDSEADDDRDIGVLVVDVASRKVLRALSTKGAWPGPIFDEVVLDDEGRRVAASSPMGVTLLWNVDNDQRFELGAMISELSFSRDGKLLVGMTDASAVLWRTTDGIRLGTFVLSKTDPDSGVFISADGRVEWLGKPQSVHVYCEAGRTELPFEVCEDRLLEPGLVARTLR